ncbi:MAG: hypothetical protein V1827_02665 [Candidatus Micrarchaeota archaeon]
MRGIRIGQEIPGNGEQPKLVCGRHGFVRAHTLINPPFGAREMNRRARELLRSLERVDGMVSRGKLPKDFEVPFYGDTVNPSALGEEIYERAFYVPYTPARLLITTMATITPLALLSNQIERLAFPTNIIVFFSSLAGWSTLVSFVGSYIAARQVLLDETRELISSHPILVELPKAINKAIEARNG